MDPIPVFTLVFAAIAAVAGPATFWLGRLTSNLVRETQEMRYAQLRPILVPISPLVVVAAPESAVDEVLPKRALQYSPNAQWVGIVYQNVGPGAALNIWGVIFGPEPTSKVPAHVTGHSARNGVPLAAGSSSEENKWSQGSTTVRGADTIAGHTLYAPRRVSLGEQLIGGFPIDARLTLTYRDVFNRRHASIFDYSEQVGWIPVFTGLVTEELLDLEREHMLQTARAQTAFQSSVAADGRTGQ